MPIPAAHVEHRLVQGQQVPVQARFNGPEQRPEGR
jgi:hypothetical protein